jgi:hypothetical protein
MGMAKTPKLLTPPSPSKTLKLGKHLESVRPILALINPDGTVSGLFSRPDEMRAFLQGGRTA